ncbi:unnamed protein product [Caretta caretta]
MPAKRREERETFTTRLYKEVDEFQRMHTSDPNNVNFLHSLINGKLKYNIKYIISTQIKFAFNRVKQRYYEWGDKEEHEVGNMLDVCLKKGLLLPFYNWKLIIPKQKGCAFKMTCTFSNFLRQK